LADFLQSGFQFVVPGQTTSRRSDLLLAQADLTNNAAGIADGQDSDGMTFTAGAFGAAGAMADGALEQRAAEDIAGLREPRQEVVTPPQDPLLIHH